MIIKKKEQVVKSLNQCHDGEGIVAAREVLFSQEKTGFRFLHETVVPPGTSIGVHPHPNTEELYVILEGKALVMDNGKEIEVNPGDVCVAHLGDSHGLKNMGQEAVKMIVVGINP